VSTESAWFAPPRSALYILRVDCRCGVSLTHAKIRTMSARKLFGDSLADEAKFAYIVFARAPEQAWRKSLAGAVAFPNQFDGVTGATHVLLLARATV
jgi:hypothetical protein